jgi:hypothetical protein
VQRRHAAKTGKFMAGNIFVRDAQHRHQRIFARAPFSRSFSQKSSIFAKSFFVKILAGRAKTRRRCAEKVGERAASEFVRFRRRKPSDRT